MKNVLVTFVPDYYPATTGFAQAFINLHRAILEYGKCDHIYVFVVRGKTEYLSPDERITVISMPTVRGRYRYLSGLAIGKTIIMEKLKKPFHRLDEILRNNNVQMILIESMFMAWLIPLLNKRISSDIPILCRIHGTGPEFTRFYRKKWNIFYEDYLLKCVFSTKGVIATTKYYFDFFNDYFLDYTKFMNKDFFILPNTTLQQQYEIECDSSREETLKLLQLGRMDRLGYFQKGYQDTIKALLYIESAYPEISSQIEYVTIGSGQCEQEFMEKASKLEIVKHTHYSHLANEEVKRIEKSCDVILLPSRCEGMSMFATEAIAAGKSMICTTGNGLDSVFVDGYNAIGITPYDYIGLANAIRMMAQDRDKVWAMGNNSRELFVENYSYSAIAQKYDTIVRYYK